MRNAFAPVALAATLMLSSVAFADVTNVPSSDSSMATPKAAKAHDPKRAACKAQWNAQATHTVAKKEFMQSCLARS